MLYILALAAAKVTTVLFMGRIFRGAGNTHARRLCIAGVVLMIVWGIGAVLAVSVNCDLERLWSTGTTATCDEDVSNAYIIFRGDIDDQHRQDGSLSLSLTVPQSWLS